MNPELQFDLDSPHAGWQKLSDIGLPPEPLFEQILFLRGYEFSSNIYLFTTGGDGLTLVDTGNDYTAFLDLGRLGFKLTDVRRIVLTHGHYDHSMGMIEVLRSHAPGTGGFELVMHEAGPRQFKELAADFGLVLRQLRGGERIELGGRGWEVIHTPGHTVDSICIHDAVSRTAFTGDTVLPHAMAEPDRKAGGSLQYYLGSVRELLKNDIANVLPGHGAPVAADGRSVIEQTYESLMLKVIGVEKQTSWINGAMELAQRGLLDEALFCCNRQVALDPGSPKAWQLKLMCLNDLGRFQEALEAVEHMSNTVPPGSAPVFVPIAKGYALMGLGKYEDSVGSFDAALAIDPSSKDAQVYKGMALYLAGRRDEAMDIESFRNEFIGRFKEEIAKRRSPPS
ncbi:MAG: MBL fold metallo-hydrolase [Terriglobales bacterium]